MLINLFKNVNEMELKLQLIAKYVLNITKSDKHRNGYINSLMNQMEKLINRQVNINTTNDNSQYKQKEHANKIYENNNLNQMKSVNSIKNILKIQNSYSTNSLKKEF